MSGLAAAVEARLALAGDLFETIRSETVDVEGVTRPAWSEADQKAANSISRVAAELGLEVLYDLAGNLYCTLPGRDRERVKDTYRITSGFRSDRRPLRWPRRRRRRDHGPGRLSRCRYRARA